MQPLENAAEWFAGGSHNGGMERMTDRQRGHVVTGFQKSRHGLLDRGAGAANDRLVLAVDVGDHHVTTHRFQDALDFFERSKHSRHATLVRRREASHFASTRADSFQRVGEGQAAGGDQRSVFAQAVAHREIRLDAISGRANGSARDRR